MPPLIPHFIHDQYQANRFTGKLEAVTIFMDISGFTAITQALMQEGKEGAEALSSILNRVFEPVIRAVYHEGGFISGFAGDAFTAIFPHHEPMGALIAAQAIVQSLLEQGPQQTVSGEFPLAVKIGLSAGEVEWGIVGVQHNRSIPIYFFRGAAIDGCAHAEKKAQQGEIVLDERLQALLPNVAFEAWTQFDDGYAKWRSGDEKIADREHLAPPGKPQAMPQDLEKIPQTASPSSATLSFPKGLSLQTTLQGEFRDVACVFISFKNIPTLKQLNAFVTQIMQAADRFGGYFNKIDFGDKGGTMLILFGAPVAYENILERALNFVLTLQKDRVPSGRSMPPVEGQEPSSEGSLEDRPVDWRAGLTFGPTYAGLVGIARRREYTVLGHAVNFSARLMMKAKWGQILVPQVITKQSAFIFDYLGEFCYKGFREPMPTYNLLGQKSVQERVFEQRMVGRQAELKKLVHVAQPMIKAGRFAGVAYIYGEAGIGKSLLCYELRKAFSTQGPLSWFTGQCDQILRQPFNPFIYFLKQYFNQSPEATPTEKQANFEKRLNQLLAKLNERKLSAFSHQLTRTKSVLGALMGLYWPNSFYERLDARARYQNTLFAIKTFLLAESRLQPVVFELEDAHWLDDASQQLLSHLTRNIGEYALFIVSTLRYSDDGSKLTFNVTPDTPTTTIDLNVLAPADLRILAEQYLGEPIDDTLHKLLLEKSQANPFYAQQILYYFRENHLLVPPAQDTPAPSIPPQPFDPSTLRPFDKLRAPQAQGTAGSGHRKRFLSLSKGRTPDWGGRAGHKPRPTEWSLTENAEFHLPTSIKAILTARLDRLPANIKEVVKVAAVQGQEFELQILTEVLRTEILPEVEGAVHEQVWASLSEMRYIFKHALLREAAYEMQLRTRLRTLHRQTAKAIEQLHAANLIPYVADLVHHYARSQDVEQERRYAILAGGHAAANFANQEALRYFSRALELTAEDDLMARLDLLLNREEVYHLQGERDAQKQELGTLESLARQLQDDRRLAEVYLRLACYGEAIGDAPAVIASAKEAIRLAQAIADKAKVAAGYTWWGQALWPEGHHEEAREKFLLALPLYREVGDKWGEGDALNNLGIVAFQQGDNEVAKDYYEQALQIRQAANDQRGEGTSLSNLGLVLHKLGDYVGAIDYYDQSWQIKRAIGDLRGEGITLLNLGFTSQAQGNHTSALTYNKQALAILREIDDRRHETIVLLNMALLSHHLGDNQSAHQYAQEVLAISEELESRYLAGYALTFQGHARVGLGHLKEAHSAYQQAHTLWQEMQLPDLAIEALAGVARVKMLEGEIEKALHHIHEILPYLEDHPTLSGAEEPLRVYLTCYHVLRANKKPASHSNQNGSRANKILQTAHGLLVEWAAKINDQNSRRMFLENVPTHREIIAEWERVCDGSTTSIMSSDPSFLSG